MKNRKAILLSGGIDSAALAYWKRPGLAINVNYGQKAAIAERRASKSIAKALKIELKCIDIDCSSLGSGDLSKRKALSFAPVSEWWPYRNQLLLTLAGMLSVSYNINELMIGAVITDKRHSDGKKKFFRLANQLMSFQEGRLKITTPAIDYRSDELIKRKRVPASIIGWTHSCHKSNFPCGDCNGCRKHIEIKTILNLIQLKETYGWFFHSPISKKGDKTPCDKLIIQTQLISPQEEVIQNLKKGDFLKLALLTRKGPCVAMHGEKIAGTIINKDILQLMECIRKKPFIAMIRGITGGRCAITIKMSTSL